MSVDRLIEEISTRDRVVVLMGPTGAGKSTFIQYATGTYDQGVGHSLMSCTQTVTLARTVDPANGQSVVFVDTPGWDDTNRSDTDILGLIAEFLSKAYKANLNLDTIVHLHRISDNRMARSPLKSLELFASLCGKEAMRHVTLVTTMWRFVANDIGEGREKALKELFWKDMMDHGCKVQRFEDSMESAWKIITKPGQELCQVLGTKIHKKSKTFSAKDRIVLVVGLTGAGKSTFISLATNRGDKPIGHDLKSHTKDIALTRAVNPFNGQSVIFVDTPGFDDTTRLDDEIFGIIVDFINRDRVNLDTILWLHRISDNRANDMSPKHLKDILKTCNGKKMPHLILATTMWDNVSVQRGEEREKQLEMEIWKDITREGCKIHRFEKTHESAWEILRDVNAISRADILLSVEMTLEHRELKETEAGRTLNKQLQRLIKEQKEMKRSLKGMAGKHVDRAVKEELAKRMEEVEKKMASIAEQMNDLKLPLPRHILRVFSGQSAPKVPTASAEVPFPL